ncbi:MAG TPA: hypothetical protein VF472_04115 [Burkholderiaceae bacterium]
MSKVQQWSLPVAETAAERDGKIPAVEVEAALAHILTSQVFAKAPRMRRLLRTLVEKTLGGAGHEVNEFTIGVEVFGRDESSYCTGEDSLVRVQVGRLRERLNVYYAGPGQDAPLMISIPLGRYVPQFRRQEPAVKRVAAGGALLLVPFAGIGQFGEGGHCASFSQGFNEELRFRLLSLFGRALAGQGAFSGAGGNALHAAGAASRFQLEGSLRVEAGRVRIAARLIDRCEDRVDWYVQFDRTGTLDISLQEDIASEICDGLRSLDATRDMLHVPPGQPQFHLRAG